MAVVYDPFTDRLYSAEKHHGAFLNGKRMHVSKAGLARHSVINTEWWADAPWDVDTAMHNVSLKTQTYVLHIGSIIQSACMVASGQLEGCVFPGTVGKNVDIAAVKLLVEEAGGTVTDIHGKKQRYDVAIAGAILTNGRVHSRIVTAIRKEIRKKK